MDLDAVLVLVVQSLFDANWNDNSDEIDEDGCWSMALSVDVWGVVGGGTLSTIDAGSLDFDNKKSTPTWAHLSFSKWMIYGWLPFPCSSHNKLNMNELFLTILIIWINIGIQFL